MSIHNLRYSVQLIQIATRNKTNLWKIPRFWRLKQLCAHSYVCRQALYVVYIVTQTPSFRRSRDLDKSNTFGQMKELTNDYYSEIKLHNIRPLNLVLIKNNFIPDPNIGTTTRQPLIMAADGGFVHKANWTYVGIDATAVYMTCIADGETSPVLMLACSRFW